MRRVYRQARPVRSGLFSLHVLNNDRIKSTRVAVVVSRKVHKSAVKRNRIRRRVYEVIRLNMADFKFKAEIVITAYQPEIAELSSDELSKELTGLLKKSGLLGN